MSTIYVDEFRNRAQRTGMLSAALGMVTSLQAVTMFFALRDLLAGGGAESVAIPVAAGGVIGVAFWIAWHWLSRVGPLAHNPVNRTMFVALAALLTATAISTTSWFVASSIGGNHALQAHMQKHLVKANDQLAVLTSNAVAEQELSDKLGQISTGWRSLADSEASGNLSDKGKGCGKDCEMYKRAASNYATSRANVEMVFEEFNTEKTKAEELRTKMNEIASSDSSPEGQSKFSTLAAQFGQQVAKMDALTALPRVGGEIVEVETKNGVTSVKNESLTKELKDKVKAIKAARKPVPTVVYATASKATATLEYASVVPGAWLVGVAFDLLPFIMFLMMMLAYSEARTPHQPMPEFAPIGGREVDVAGNRTLRSVA